MLSRPARGFIGEALRCSLAAVGLAVIDAADDGPVVLVDLTAAELPLSRTEVLDLILLGLPNKRIGLRLGIAERTVKHHVSALMRKFGVRDRTGLIMLKQEAAADASARVPLPPD